MRSKWFLLLLVLASLCLVAGCEVSVNEGDDDSESETETETDTESDTIDIGAGFSWSWTVNNSVTSAVVTCDQAGAMYAQIDIVDANSVAHKIQWLCSAGTGQTDSWKIATGEATVTASLLNANQEALSVTEPYQFTFQSGTINNVLDTIDFSVNIWDPNTGATASLTWEWRKATVEDVTDPSTEADPFTAEMCTRMGIDYAYLWVWNPNAQAWWSDPAVTEFRCDAYDHPEDDAIWGNEVYSGLYLNDFLVPGKYQFLLGFYAAGETAEKTDDMLLYQFSAGSAGDDNDGVLDADEETTDGTNFYWAVFPFAEQEFGVLKIALQWGTGDAGIYYDTCADSTVKTMGFLLQNDGWIAAEVPLSDGGDCLDGLEFDKVPVLETPYELIVSALSVDDEFLWHHSCGDLFPEAPDVAVGYTCKIENQLTE